MKGIIIFLYRIVIQKKLLRKKSVMDINIWHTCILGFVNAFGYILPTIFMFKRGVISAFEYLFQSLFLDLFFTIVLSALLLKRTELQTFKILLPLALAVFGMGFHYTVYMGSESDTTLNILKFNFTAQRPAKLAVLTPSVESKYFYIFLITRLSKCFVCIGSKLFLLKEQAYRKALTVIKNQERKKVFIEE